MTHAAQTTHVSDATAETLDLLQPEIKSHSYVGSGYVDVLGGEKRVGPNLTQQVFRSKVMTLIYERLGRPLGAKYIFGRKLNFAVESSTALEMLALAPSDRVLDVGCGPGNYTRRIAETVTDGLIVGVDPSQPMIVSAAAQGGGANLSYVRGDGVDLPFRDAQFDVVCCVGVIHLVPDPMKVLDEMARMLTPEGRILIGTTWRKGKDLRFRGLVTRFGASTIAEALEDRGLEQSDQWLTGRGQFVVARRMQ